MPDVSCVFTLVTPGGTIIFNDGAANEFAIQEIPSGLSGTPLSAPIDPISFGDGSRAYSWWKRGRHITIEGVFLVTSTPVYQTILGIRNQMEDDLLNALESISGDEADTGTLTWTPYGQDERQLTVRCEVPLECPHDQEYMVRNFAFGLFAENADWTIPVVTWADLFAALPGLLVNGWSANHDYASDLASVFPAWVTGNAGQAIQFLQPTGFSNVFAYVVSPGQQTGGSEPNWAAYSNVGDSVFPDDGDFEWLNCGLVSDLLPIAPWLPNTVYNDFSGGSGPISLPITAVTSDQFPGRVYVCYPGNVGNAFTSQAISPTFVDNGAIVVDNGSGTWLDMGVIPF